MNRPQCKRYWIHGDLWTELWVKASDPRLQGAQGICDPATRTIYLSTEILADEHEAVKLILHERLHAVWRSADIRLDREVDDLEEDIVERLTSGLVGTFMGNLKLRST